MLLLLLLCLPLASCFWDQGHMVVSQIGYNSIAHPSARTRYDDLLGSMAAWYPNSSTPLLVGAWMDDIKQNVYNFHSWHYKDSPVYANDYTGARDKRSPKVNIVWAIRRCIISLRDPLESPLEQAIALRILIHLLGDLHQPLHNSELYSAAFPNGDMGGNNVKVRTIAGERLNLHKFWDSGGGPTTGIFKDSPYCCYPHYNRDPAFVHYLMAKVDVLAATHVAEHVLSNSTINVEGWHMEGWELAVQSVYPGAFLHGGNLTALYTQDAVEILERQIRIAGVRLGKVLDYALGEDNGDDDAIDGTLLISIQIIVSFIVLAMFLGWKRCGADSPAPPAGSTPLPSNEPPGVDLPDLGSTQQLTIMMPVGSVPLVDHSTL